MQTTTFAPSVPRNAGSSVVSSTAPAAPPADRALAVPHQHPRHRTQPAMSCHQPANRSSARGSGSAPPTATGSTRSPSSAPAAASAVRTCPNPTGSSISGEPQIALRDLARPHNWCDSPDPAADTPAAARATRPLKHPDRAGPADPLRDHRRRHRRTRLQQLPDPRLDLVHDRPRRRPLDTSAARRDANAARTVFLEHPITRAITLIGIPSARCNRRISAQSSTLNTPSSSLARVRARVTGRGSKFGCRAGVSFHVPSTPNIIQEYWLMSSPRLRIGVRLSIGTRPRECMPGRRLPHGLRSPGFSTPSLGSSWACWSPRPCERRRRLGCRPGRCDRLCSRQSAGCRTPPLLIFGSCMSASRSRFADCSRSTTCDVAAARRCAGRWPASCSTTSSTELVEQTAWCSLMTMTLAARC